MEIRRTGRGTKGELKCGLKGKRIVLEQILTHRFGRLPDWGREQLAKANMDQLDRWADRVLDTDSIQSLLAE